MFALLVEEKFRVCIVVQAIFQDAIPVAGHKLDLIIIVLEPFGLVGDLICKEVLEFILLSLWYSSLPHYMTRLEQHSAEIGSLTPAFIADHSSEEVAAGMIAYLFIFEDCLGAVDLWDRYENFHDIFRRGLWTPEQIECKDYWRSLCHRVLSEFERTLISNIVSVYAFSLRLCVFSELHF